MSAVLWSMKRLLILRKSIKIKSEALHFVTEQYLVKSQYQNNCILNFENILLPPAFKGYYLKLLLTFVCTGHVETNSLQLTKNEQ